MRRRERRGRTKSKVEVRQMQKYTGKKVVAQQAIKLDKPGAKLMNEKNRAVVMQN